MVPGFAQQLMTGSLQKLTPIALWNHSFLDCVNVCSRHLTGIAWHTSLDSASIKGGSSSRVALRSWCCSPPPLLREPSKLKQSRPPKKTQTKY